MKKIGIFDSGYGGLTVFEAIRKRLPQYDYVYLGDNARTPYGTRSFDVVYDYTLQSVKTLFELGAELVILACNTASAKALRNIQQFDLPKIDPHKRVLGVIRPSAEAVGRYTKSRNVGVFGTQGTVDSMSYPIEIQKLWGDIKVFQQPCPMWVPIVENGEYANDGADFFVEKYVRNLMDQSPDIDSVILACTHYPMLLPKIRKYIPQNVKILSQGEIVADSLEEYLRRHPEMENCLGRDKSVRFFTTESSQKFSSTASIFFDGKLDVESIQMR